LRPIEPAIREFRGKEISMSVNPATGVEQDQNWEWNIAVFCQNEAARIGQCIASIAAAIGSHRALVTVIVNGSTDDSAAVAWQAARAHGVPIAIWRIPHGDKANAIDQFLYKLRVPAQVYFFVDAYVKIGPRALEGLAASLAARPAAVAATGVAINGRTMLRHTRETLEVGGKLHGQLHALRPEFVDRMVGQGIALPIGLYYGDGLMGSMAAHDLDATGRQWDNGRVVGVAEATYEIPSLSIFAPRDLRRQFRRKIRQMRGRLENAAIKTVIYQHGFAALPTYSDDMIAAYLDRHGVPPTSLVDRFFMRLAVRHHRAAGRADAARLMPELLTFR
jgi:hypothetical protein